MLPEFPAVAKCRGCQRFYWVDEAEVRGEIEVFGPRTEGVPREWERAEPIEHLTIDEYIEALDAGVGTDATKQRHLRIHLWWAINDKLRLDSGVEIPAGYVEQLRENLGRLSALLDERDAGDRVMKAEAARETGDFARAMELLADVPVEYRWAADRIVELSRSGNSRVAQLSPGQPRRHDGGAAAER